MNRQVKRGNRSVEIDGNFVHALATEFKQDIVNTVLKLVNNAGFQLPIHAAVIAANGTTYILRYELRRDLIVCMRIHEHTPDPRGLAVPVNALFVDSRGRGARLELGQVRWMNLSVIAGVVSAIVGAIVGAILALWLPK